MKLVLLPGMDGTGILFEPLLKSLSESISPIVVTYPCDVPLSYAELLQVIESKLPSAEPFIVLGESFSGPLALRIAASCPPGLKGLVLSASFARNPIRYFPRVCSRLIRPFLFYNLPLRAMLAGYSASPLLQLVRRANEIVTPQVLACRARAAIEVDAEDVLAACSYPILYLAASKDRIVRKHNYARIKKINPNVRLVVLPAPHLLLQAAPDEAAREIAGFAETLASG